MIMDCKVTHVSLGIEPNADRRIEPLTKAYEAEQIRYREAMNTKDISFNATIEDDGYCDTCSSPYAVTYITVLNTTKELP